MSDYIAELHAAYRYHAEITAAIAETLDIIEHDPIARLRVACAHYDAGHDPDANQLAAALEATLNEKDE